MINDSFKDSALRLKQFLLSQYFYDGLKITFGVILPSVIFYQFGLLETGVTFSLGALYISMADNPGPLQHKRNGMLISLLCVFLVSLIIGFSNRSILLLCIEIPVLCFFFSMFTVYGTRASSIGIAALLVLVIGIDQRLDAIDTLFHTGYIVAGGLWYLLFSLSIQQVMPYRPAEQTLGECIEQVAEYMRVKATFYDIHTDIENDYSKLIDQQIIVQEHSDNVREIIFRTRRILKDSTSQGRALIITFIDLVDLYEHTMATQYDYHKIREEYGKYPVLNLIKSSILHLADDLEYIGKCIHNHEEAKALVNNEDDLRRIKSEIDKLEEAGIQTLALKKILINLRNISQRIQRIYGYRKLADIKIPASRKKNFKNFVSNQPIDYKIFTENLTFSSSIFRHSLRVALVCLAAFIFAINFYKGQHSYWILLTIIVILKPAFSLTRKRNYERIIGTIAGGFVGILILAFFGDESTRFWFLLFFMLLSYSFLRIRYVVSVLFMTPFILILFSFIGHNSDMLILRERIMDTIIGGVSAALASYVVFPNWESKQIKNMMSKMTEHHIVFLKSVVEYQIEDISSHAAYRLARKQMYVSTANLASAFQRMSSEPKSKQQNASSVNKFLVLSHTFSSYATSFAHKIIEDETLSEDQIKQLRKITFSLKESYEILSDSKLEIQEPSYKSNDQKTVITDDILSQLIQIAADIKKVSLTFRK